MNRSPRPAIAPLTLRHWTINSQEFVGGSQRPAPAPSYSENADGGQVQLLASKLARVKSALAHDAS
jgi:hypothetical protein